MASDTKIVKMSDHISVGELRATLEEFSYRGITFGGDYWDKQYVRFKTGSYPDEVELEFESIEHCEKTGEVTIRVKFPELLRVRQFPKVSVNNL